MKQTFLRRILPWLIVAGVADFAVYNLKNKPAEDIVPNEIQDEVMGTGTLEARVKTKASARIQKQLAEVLVDQGDKVKAGQRLTRPDDAETKQQVAQRCAGVLVVTNEHRTLDVFGRVQEVEDGPIRRQEPPQ